MTCKFCNIAKHVKKEHIVYEDKEIMAFMSIEELSKAHVLVIPKEHYKNIYELDDKIASKLFITVKNIAKKVEKAVKPDGLNIYQCNGKIADQSVFHFHIHIFPRFKNDGLFSIYNHKKPKYESENYLENIALKIRKIKVR